MKSSTIFRIWKGRTSPRSVRLRRSSAENAFPVKLLFDANLTPKLISRLVDLLPGSVRSVHLFGTGLEKFAAGEEFWRYAAAYGFSMVKADRGLHRDG